MSANAQNGKERNNPMNDENQTQGDDDQVEGADAQAGTEAGADQAGCGSDVTDADDQPGNTAAPGAPEPVSGDDAPAGNDGDDDGA